MTEKTSKIIISKELTPACVPILLDTYKHGLLVSDYPSAKFDELRRNKYIGYHKERFNDKDVHVLWLLPAGAAFVDKHFMSILEQMSLAHSYPIVKQGDIIEVVEPILNSYDDKKQMPKKLVHSPSGSSSLDTGLYVVQAIDRASVLVTDDMSIRYRLNLEKTKKMIRFAHEELTDEDSEKQRRFGKIQVKYIVGRLQDRMNALTMVEIVDTLYEMPYTKDRVEHE